MEEFDIIDMDNVSLKREDGGSYMSKKLVIKRCPKCMAMVKVMKENDSEIMCCGKAMEELVPNVVEASFEKHVPNYLIKDGKIIVTVNHVMEDDHYIEWICMCSGNKEFVVYFEPGDVLEAEFTYMPGAILYAYCNKHLLWKKEVE